MGKTNRCIIDAKYKRGILDDSEVSIEYKISKKKQNLKKAKYNKKVDKEVIELDNIEDN